MKGKIAILGIAIIAIAIVAYSYQTSQNQMNGTITVSGANALYPTMILWAQKFHELNPQVRIDVSAGGAGKGMTDALAGLVNIGMVSRNVTSAEVAKGAFYVAVCNDAIVMTVNANNPVLQDIQTKGITQAIFKGIYIYGTVTTWGQVVGRPEVTDRIDVYTRSDSCGASEVFAKYLGSNYTQGDLKGTAVNGDPGVAQAVKNDVLGIGYDNIAYAYDSSTKKPVEGLAVVPLDINSNGVVDSAENFYATMSEISTAVSQGAYPSPPVREDNLVTNGAFTGVTKDFVRWILTEGQQYCTQTGEVALSAARQQEMLNKLG